MTFSVHTFEVGDTGGFAFHEEVGEGQSVYFLSHFSKEFQSPQGIAEAAFGAIVSSFETSRISNSYDKFEDALKAANLEMRKMLGSSQEIPEIIVAFFDFHNLYLTQSGSSEAYLVRGSNVSQISETPEGGDDLFRNILSGQVSINDTILLATNRVLRFVTSSQLADIFSREAFSDAVKVFRHELSISSEEDIVVTAIGIGKKEDVQSAGFLSKVVSKVSNVNKGDDEVELPPATPEPEILDDVVEESTESSSRDTKSIFSRFSNLNKQEKNKLVKKAVIFLGIIGVGILAFFLMNIVLNYESQDEKALRDDISIANQALLDAEAFLLRGERQAAGEKLQKAESLVQNVLKSNNQRYRSNAQFLLADIEEKKLNVENAKRVSAQLLADLGVKNDKLDALGVIFLNNSLYVYDTKKVYKTVRNLVEKGLPISERETIVAGTSREDQNVLLFVTDSPRIVEYKEGLISPMATEDETWKTGIDIKTFGRYAYILNPTENQIWKYQRKSTKYSGATAYNQGNVDLSQAVSFAIDGSIFILSADGSIQKLFRGEKQDFSFNDLPSKPFSGKNLKLYTSAELEYVYVLDPDNSRVLIFTKGEKFATYKRQVLFNIEGARDFFVDDSGQKVNVLTNAKIYEFSL